METVGKMLWVTVSVSYKPVLFLVHLPSYSLPLFTIILKCVFHLACKEPSTSVVKEESSANLTAL